MIFCASSVKSPCMAEAKSGRSCLISLGLPCPRRLSSSTLACIFSLVKCTPRDLEIPLEAQLLDHRLLTRRKMEFRVHGQVPGHDWGFGLDAELEHVIDARRTDSYIEGNVMAGHALRANHVSNGDNVRMRKYRIYRLQMCVPVRAIDDRVKFGMKWHRVSGHVEAEIGCIGFTIDHNIIERALVYPFDERMPAIPFSVPRSASLKLYVPPTGVPPGSACYKGRIRRKSRCFPPA